jgi:tetratricopeptide (TPR) repeat protein
MQPRALVLLLIGLIMPGALGCVTLPGSPSTANGEEAAQAQSFAKRKPRASTYVAYGELHEKAASEPGRTAADQAELLNKARLAYQKALEIDPKDAAALLALARLYSSLGDYERAVATYNRAIQSHPKETALRYELGMCHARFKKWEPAIQSLQSALQGDPDNRRYRYNYGLCLARARRYGESLLVLEKLEGPANAHYDLARMMYHLDQDEACKEQLRMALAKNPNLVGAQQLLAELENATPSPAKPITPATATSPN